MATAPQVVGEIINIGPDEEFISVNELAEKLANITGCNLAPVHMADRPREVKLATCSADKARKLLGYETRVFLDDGLKELVDWIRVQGPKPFTYHFDIEIHNELLPQTWRDRLI
jgi:UDP-glucose 4-epimerase